MLLDSAEPHDVEEYIAEQTANEKSCWYSENGKRLSRSQVYRYVRHAWKRINETSKVSRRRLFRRHLAQRRNIVAKSISAGDLRTALAALDSEARLLNLHEPPSKPAKNAGTPEGAVDVAAMLAARLREIEKTELPASERVRMTSTLAAALLQAIDAGETQQKLDELLGRLDDADAKRKAAEKR